MNGSGPDLTEECAAIASLVGTHPAVAAPHPQVDVAFIKSHFGPEITQRVIDYGDPQAAADALDAVAEAATACAVYEQQTSGPGVDRYRVSRGEPVDDTTNGATVHLAAIGGDFKDIHWDIWVTESDGQLIAITLRSARGGSSVDLAPAVSAAQARL